MNEVQNELHAEFTYSVGRITLTSMYLFNLDQFQDAQYRATVDSG
jgi:hypothetical protein